MTARRTRPTAKARLLRSGPPSVRSPAPAALIGFTYPNKRGTHTRGTALLRNERQKCLQLDLGLGQLLGGDRLADDPAARVQVRHAPPEEGAAERHAELAVLRQ